MVVIRFVVAHSVTAGTSRAKCEMSRCLSSYTVGPWTASSWRETNLGMTREYISWKLATGTEIGPLDEVCVEFRTRLYLLWHDLSFPTDAWQGLPNRPQTGGSGVRIPIGARFFFSSLHLSRPTLWSIRLPIQWVQTDTFIVVTATGHEDSHWRHAVRRLTINGAAPPLFLFVFTVCTVTGQTDL